MSNIELELAKRGITPISIIPGTNVVDTIVELAEKYNALLEYLKEQK